MDPIAHLTVATLCFLGAHFVPSTPLRATLVKALSERGYLGAYSFVAFAALGWMIWAYSRAPVQPVWQVPGLRLLPLAVMPFALILLAASLTTRNPTAVGQSGALKAAEPARGIIRVTRHPLMWGVMLWAGVHILARGDLASLVFFGGFLALAGIGSVLIDARKADSLGDEWRKFAAVTSNVPFGAIVDGRNRLVLSEIGWKRAGLGLALYAALVFEHPLLFGARAY